MTSPTLPAGVRLSHWLSFPACLWEPRLGWSAPGVPAAGTVWSTPRGVPSLRRAAKRGQGGALWLR